jgi:hypothetical protein
MASQPEFIRRQYEFAAHIRDPQHAPAPVDVEERRMSIYCELFYNNVEGFLSGTFPVLRKIQGDGRWHAMARDFFAHHHSRTPLFLEISREFLSWLRDERTPQPEDLPFLLELAHYEWTELALSVAEATITTDGIDPDGDLLDGIPVLSPLAWQLGYTWPVHKIGPDFLPDTPGPQPTCLVIYRTRRTRWASSRSTGYQAPAGLIDEDRNRSGRELLEQIAAELSHPDPAVVVRVATKSSPDYAKSVITGTRMQQ